MAKVIIEVEQYSGLRMCYIARLKQPTITEVTEGVPNFGDTPAEAIGELVSHFPALFDVEIIIKKSKQD